MSDYDDIMKPIMAGDVQALEGLAQLIPGFPTDKDDFIRSSCLFTKEHERKGM